MRVEEKVLVSRMSAPASADSLTSAIGRGFDPVVLDGVTGSGKTEIYTPTPAEKALWVKAMSVVQDEMASRIGKDLIVAIRKEANGK